MGSDDKSWQIAAIIIKLDEIERHKGRYKGHMHRDAPVEVAQLRTLACGRDDPLVVLRNWKRGV